MVPAKKNKYIKKDVFVRVSKKKERHKMMCQEKVTASKFGTEGGFCTAQALSEFFQVVCNEYISYL